MTLDITPPASTASIRQIQTGYHNAAASSAGAGEDARYVDATITAVLDATRCVVFIQPAVAENYTSRLTSTTNVRVSRPSGGAATISGRWYVVEYV